ncbi:DUF790 family protein, partial [Deinococcus piscis]|uniref:DUF790 family protein n=1 Tax=Deinococcus piscis TaxID=394230 RepID=UPI0016739CC8
MLPTELLSFRVKGGVVEPRRLKATPGNLELAETLIGTFEQHLGHPRYELKVVVRKILQATFEDSVALSSLTQ